MDNIKSYMTTEAALADLQRRFGTAMWRSYEYIRQMFYSYVPYLTAGATQYNFFQDTISTRSLQFTNMKNAGSFTSGEFFLVNNIRLDVYTKTRADVNSAWSGLDAATFVSDFLMGFMQAGYLQWDINSTEYLKLPQPFLYAPPANGEQDVQNRGYTGATPTVSGNPWATLNSRRHGLFVVDPAVLLEPNQGFQISLNFPRGVIPVIGSSIINDSTNPLYVGAIIDGLWFRPRG